ncbi:PREDICTED: uncharacterized protein LOC105364076 [Ceratosolen solmsi marchali]|uniref:Uncharacterized protein LOC105364076 n=1 Tax=Ceratosolen solmsi marchali TaxID=326594 RepID=A0AAJ6YLE2_9HYME|nr:PREDICTED: uncharacterized protein LOC105364076 [Ceratosolen solmsi marchali]
MSTQNICDQSVTQGPGYVSHLKRLSRVENICKNPCSPSSPQSKSDQNRKDATTSLEFITSSVVNKNPKEKAMPCCPCSKNTQSVKLCIASTIGTNDKCSKEKILPSCPCNKNVQVSRAGGTKTTVKCPDEKITVPCNEQSQSSKVCDISTIIGNKSSNEKSLFCPCTKNSQGCKMFETSAIATSDEFCKEKSSRICKTSNTTINDNYSKERVKPCYLCSKNTQTTNMCETTIVTANDKCSTQNVTSLCSYRNNPQNPSKGSCVLKKSDICTKEIYPGRTSSCMDKRGFQDSTNDKSIGTADNPKIVRFESTRGVRRPPRVAARFEDGVLEAYSEFKIVFPNGNERTSNCLNEATELVETQHSTEDCGVSINFVSTDCDGKANHSSMKNCCNMKCGDNNQSTQCEIIEIYDTSVINAETQTSRLNEDKSISCQDFFRSCNFTDYNKVKCQGSCATRDNCRTVIPCSKLLKYRPGTSPSISKDVNWMYIRCLKCKPNKTTDFENCTCFEDNMKTRATCNKLATDGPSFTLEARNEITREKCSRCFNKAQQNAKKGRG